MRRKRRRKRSSSSNNNKMRVLQSKCPYCIPVQQRILATCSDQDAGWTGTFLASTASRLARDPPSRPSNGYSSRAYSVLRLRPTAYPLLCPRLSIPGVIPSLPHTYSSRNLSADKLDIFHSVQFATLRPTKCIILYLK